MLQNLTKTKVNRRDSVNPTFKKNLNDEEEVKTVKRPKQKKKKRLIIRNLSFKVEENDLTEIFSKFGTLKEVKIPLKEDGKKRGFGFVEFEDTKSLINAMKSMNYKEIKGRKVAVDFAVDKNTYQLKVQSLRKDKPEEIDRIKTESEIKQEPVSEEDDSDESEEEDEDEKRLKDFLKEFDSGAEKLTKNQVEEEQMVSSDESSSESEEEDDSEGSSDEEESPKKKIKHEHDETSSSPKKSKVKDSHDVSEGKTVFLRNVSFGSTKESLREAMEEFGECEYCLLCMDQYTDHPKGTAFVKFKEKSSADKLVKDSSSDPGVLVDGRKLTCSLAVSKGDASAIGEKIKKPKDKRNLYLLRVGLIMANSKESEGVSAADMTRRTQLEIFKKQKLKNVNFFVSNRRLMVHNLPKTFNDYKLRMLFKKAAGKGAVIKEARVMKEFKKIDAKGDPLSKGYGFVSFTEHEDALQALNKLNNNPHIFTSLKRPIVEFSIENKVALLSKERKKEKNQTRNKRRAEEKKERQLKQEVADDAKKNSESSTQGKKRKKKNKKNKNTTNKTEEKEDIPEETTDSPTKQKKKKRRKPRPSKEEKLSNNKSRQENMTNLVNKFKDKLINKIT